MSGWEVEGRGVSEVGCPSGKRETSRATELMEHSPRRDGSFYSVICSVCQFD